MQTTIQKRLMKLTSIALSLLILMSAYLTKAQESEFPKPGPEHKKLEVWVGEWIVEGAIKDTPLGPGFKIVGKQSGQMILDGLCLEIKYESKKVLGNQKDIFKEVGVMRYDPLTKKYHDHFCNNLSMFGVSKTTTTVNENIWTSIGTETDTDGKILNIRYTGTLSPDQKTFTRKGDISLDDGKTWLPYWDLTLKKVEITTVEQEIIKMSSEWDNAYVKRDADALRRIEAEDYVGIDEEGNVITKQQDIAEVLSGEYKQLSVVYDEPLKVRVNGNTAVATACTTLKQEYKGKDTSGQTRSTTVWVKRDNRWQLLSWHGSKLKK